MEAQVRKGSHTVYEYVYWNPDIKKRYIEFHYSRVKIAPGSLERLFTKTNPFEERLQKDVSCFTSSEIREMLKTIGFISPESAANFNAQLSSYTVWSISENLVPDYQNHYFEIKDFYPFVNIKSAKRKIVSREDIIRKTSHMNECDRFAMVAIFEGINGLNRQELINLTIGDVNREKQTITVHGEIFIKNKNKWIPYDRTVKVSEELIDMAYDSYMMETYTAASGRQFKIKDTSDHVIKAFTNSRDDIDMLYKGRRLYFRLEKALRDTELADISINSIAESGKIWKINEIAKREGISGVDVLADKNLVIEIETQYNCSMRSSVYLQKYYDYLSKSITTET